MTLSPLASGAICGKPFSASTWGSDGRARVRPRPYCMDRAESLGIPEFRLCDAGRLPARAAAHTWLADFSVARSAHDQSGRISGVDFQGCAALDQAWTDGCTHRPAGPEGQMISRDLFLTVLDSDMAMYTHNNTDDEFTHQNFCNTKGTRSENW
jgi:hypothetical protein